MPSKKQPVADVGYYTHPTIHGDQVVFVCEGDLWTVSVEDALSGDAAARRLTNNPGTSAFPVLSPDGSHVAFTGRDDGPPEVYVMPAEGGTPRRITYLGSSLLRVVGWRDDNTILFSSNFAQPFLKAMHLHEVSIDGGAHRPLGLGPASAISFAPSGKGTVLGRNSGDPARWKRYRGGTAGTIWIDKKGDNAFERLIDLDGNLADPMWIGSRIFFLSDHEGFGNLYSCTPKGGGLERHTDHEAYYLRFPRGDGARIVYHMGADLFVLDPKTGKDEKLDIRIKSSRPDRNRKYVLASKHLETFDLHPEGHTLASVHRGGLFTMPLWEGAPTRYGTPSSVRYRLGAWLPDGKRLVAISDDSGEEGIVVFEVAGDAAKTPTEPKKRIRGDFGRPHELQVAPAGRPFVAMCNQRNEVLVVDLETAKKKTVTSSVHGRPHGLAWSPDGRWLAFAMPTDENTCSLHLFDSRSGKLTQITRSEFNDTAPSFDAKGRYLYFVSWRVYDPVYDSHFFDLGFVRGARPHLITLKADEFSPFETAHRTPRPPVPGEPKPGNNKNQEPPKVEIDLDGISDRVIAFPVPEGRYGRVQGAGNRVLFSLFPIEGSLDRTWAASGEPAAKGTLQYWDLDKDRVEVFKRRITDFEVGGGGKVIAIRWGNHVRVVPAIGKPGPNLEKREVGRESGVVDLGRIRLLVVPGDEWRQMFHEAWRMQRDQFWTEDMSGIDWQAIHDRYLPLVDRVATRGEFSDLMWEMQGELGTSHCYELAGDYRPRPIWRQGQLGADLEFRPRRGWRITRIPRGDSWKPAHCSPFSVPGVNVQEGTEIVAVDGRPVGAECSPFECLVHQAGRPVELIVRTKAKKPKKGKKGKKGAKKPASESRRITIRTLPDETPLRYRDWVEHNRARVHKDSKERVGYIHVPNMGPIGFAEFHRYFRAEVTRDALVIDVRYNGGGHVSQLLLQKLLRRRIGFNQSRWGTPTSYPGDAPGPMVALTNEYAGSDGDIFSHSFKLFGLGPLIGTRTWGGVVGIWPRHSLVDGTITTQPEFAFWFEDVGWNVENYGTDPDIEVDIRPQDWAKGEDPQLDRAVTEVKKLLRDVAAPDLGQRPKRAPKRLPKRRKGKRGK